MPDNTAALRFRRICDRQIKAGNRAWVEDLLTKALTLIAAGKGQLSALANASLNGKSFSRIIQLTALDEADIAQSALDAEDGEASSDSTGITVPDFGA